MSTIAIVILAAIALTIIIGLVLAARHLAKKKAAAVAHVTKVATDLQDNISKILGEETPVDFSFVTEPTVVAEAPVAPSEIDVSAESLIGAGHSEYTKPSRMRQHRSRRLKKGLAEGSRSANFRERFGDFDPMFKP